MKKRERDRKRERGKVCACAGIGRVKKCRKGRRCVW